MEILLSNDDGYYSKGIRELEKVLSDRATITMVAPETNCSGASSSLTLKNPLRIRKFQSNGYYVNGTPSDCVYLALTSIVESKPDLVISGINYGQNLGDDVLYSGTVGAAMGGRSLGVPCLAISITSLKPQYLETALIVTKLLVDNYINHRSLPNQVYNINIPDIPYEEVQEPLLTRLGKRDTQEAITRPDKDRYGDTIYWVGGPPPPKDASEGTDFFAVQNNHVSITPLVSDFTDYQSLSAKHRSKDGSVQGWIAHLSNELF